MIRRTLLLLTMGAIALQALALPAAPALAHARWKSSTPGQGEAITASPARVEITFSQEIQKIAGGFAIEVVKDRGADVTAGPAVVDETDRHKLSVPLKADLAPGRYVVNWSNTSDADGDPATGAFSFYLNYQPNTVDLANDAQLTQVGLEAETPAADSTPGAATAPASTSSATRTIATATSNPAKTPAAASPTAVATSDGGDDSNATLIVVIIVAAIAGVVIGFGVFAMRRRS